MGRELPTKNDPLGVSQSCQIRTTFAKRSPARLSLPLRAEMCPVASPVEAREERWRGCQRRHQEVVPGPEPHSPGHGFRDARIHVQVVGNVCPMEIPGWPSDAPPIPNSARKMGHSDCLLGLSCIYCHKHVEDSPHATIPSTQTCMNCHRIIKATSPLLEAVRASSTAGDPIRWRRVHKVPDFVFFNHAVHVRRGIGCVSCHGKVDEMPLVVHDQPLSMGWCLDCHRHPETALRPMAEVTNLNWVPPDGQTQRELGIFLNRKRGIQAADQCSACHR